MFAKVSEVKEGDTLVADGGFTCIKAGDVVIEAQGDELGFKCRHGFHDLVGQIDIKDGVEVYVGLTLKV